MSLASMPGDPLPDPFLRRKRGAAELYLIRHADALPGAEDVNTGGNYDLQPLSQLGKAQAAALAERLREVPFAALYSSPLGRTQETAAPLAALKNQQVILVPDLREIRLGQVGPDLPIGATPAEVAAMLRRRLETIVQMAGTTGHWTAIPGSEPSASFRARIVAAIDEIGQRYPGERVAIFTHGGVINAYTAVAIGLEKDFFFPPVNTGISIVRVLDSKRSLWALNDVAHLVQAKLL